MPSLASIQYIDGYWATFLGCSVEAIYSNQALVLPHAGMGNYRGALLFRRGPSCIISLPAPLVDAVADRLGDSEPEEVFTVEFLKNLFGNAVERVVGPAYLGYADATDIHFREENSSYDTRLLTEADRSALRKLEAACGDQEWEHSTVDPDRPPIFGCFNAGQLVAAGTLERLGSRLRSVGIVTHPSYRGRGYGKAVVTAMTRFGLEQGSILQYRTLHANTPSIAIARSLGYYEYAATLAVRLNEIRQ